MRKKFEILLRFHYKKKIEKVKYKKEKEKNKISGKFMNRIVVAMILAAFIFTITMIVLFARTGSEPSTLIENVFQFLSVEGGAMALIKSVKTFTKRKDSDKEAQG